MLPWVSYPSLSALTRALSILTPDSADTTFGLLAFQVLFVLAALWAAVFVFMAVQIGRAFLLDLHQSPAVLKAFRMVASLSASVLFLPVSSLLLRGFACDSPTNDWYGTTL